MSIEEKKAITNRRSLSFSSDYIHLAERLEEMPKAANRFICEAIAEKFERMDNPEKYTVLSANNQQEDLNVEEEKLEGKEKINITINIEQINIKI